MAVFRVEKNSGYTVMSNHHLRNRALSLKAKGLLSQMLSLPEDWDYTLQGLARINRESIDAIRQAIRELEQAGYIQRSRERDEKGRLRGADYVMNELKKSIHDNANGLDYTLVNDHYLPNLTATAPAEHSTGRWGRLHKMYLKEQHADYRICGFRPTLHSDSYYLQNLLFR